MLKELATLKPLLRAELPRALHGAVCKDLCANSASPQAATLIVVIDWRKGGGGSAGGGTEDVVSYWIPGIYSRQVHEYGDVWLLYVKEAKCWVRAHLRHCELIFFRMRMA